VVVVDVVAAIASRQRQHQQFQHWNNFCYWLLSLGGGICTKCLHKFFL